jgi:hypothetical protein
LKARRRPPDLERVRLLDRSVVVLGLTVVVGAVGPAGALAKAPSVSTLPVSTVGPHSAVVRGTLNPNDKPATYSFEYGTTTAYGAATAAASLAKGKVEVTVNATLTALEPNTTYHVRLVASNSDGITRGADVAFTTSGDPTAPEAVAPAPGDAGALPSVPGTTTAPPLAPVLGQSVNVVATTGTVVVRLPGAASAVPLQAASSIPVGTIVDTRQGVVALTTALPGGATQGATVHGGLFQVRQPASGRGMTELVLRGRKPSCATARAAAVADRRPPRQLWASDHHGRFRTRGSNAVATVRGTSWYMADRCDGTYTRVKRGSVAVRDLRTGRTVLLRAGQSHLARATR